jgi:hypothetical protein
LLESVISKIEKDVDAVRLVNNLAANSEEAARLFAEHPHGIESLKVFLVSPQPI